MKAWLKAKRGKAAPDAAEAPTAAPAVTESATRVILADIALRTGGALLKRGVERGILGRAPGLQGIAKAAAGAAKAAKPAAPKRGLATKLLTAAATRVATRSVPGAIVVGSALLARTLYEKRRARKRDT
jgi:hypothetical protein